jgi:hypothetical protein
MGFNPFSSDNEDSSFEQGLPVNKAVKSVTKTAASQVKKQNDDFAKAMRDQLYGLIPGGQDQSADDATDPQTGDQKNASHSAGAQKGTNTNANQNQNQTPDEQAKMEKIRHELFANYSMKFKSAANSAQNITTDLEQEIEKARQERKRKEEERKREEEEEEKRKKEEEERAKQQDLAMPAGKKTGMQMGKKQQQPIALRLAKTKTEINRGTTG